MKILNKVIFVVVAILLGTWSNKITINQLSLETLTLFATGRGEVFVLQREMQLAEQTDCKINWLRYMIASREQDIESEYSNLERVLKCDKYYGWLLTASENVDEKIVLQYVKAAPDSYLAWYLYSQEIAKIDNFLQVEYLREALKLNPYFGLGWCKLGLVYEDRKNYEQAEKAFLSCCRSDDPGNHGCFGAGRMAEKLSDPQKAIQYYRMSDWEGSLKRADELEAQLNSGK